MCGIIAAINPKEAEPVNGWVMNTLHDQLSRGKEGFGVTFVNDELHVNTERSTEISGALVPLHLNKANIIMLHHRMPTSTENTVRQTHPIAVTHKSLKHDYLIIHNGCISNDKELKKEHEELGFVYTTDGAKSTYGMSNDRFNDSEPLCIEVARFIEKQTDKIGARGSAAFVALQVSKSTGRAIAMFWGRNESNPLQVSNSRGFIRLSSQGRGESCTPFRLYGYSIEGRECLKSRKMAFAAWRSSSYEHDWYDGYPSKPINSPTTAKAVTTSSKTIAEQRDENKTDAERYQDYWDKRFEEEAENAVLDNEDELNELEGMLDSYRNRALKEINDVFDMLEDPYSQGYFLDQPDYWKDETLKDVGEAISLATNEIIDILAQQANEQEFLDELNG